MGQSSRGTSFRSSQAPFNPCAPTCLLSDPGQSALLLCALVSLSPQPSLGPVTGNRLNSEYSWVPEHLGSMRQQPTPAYSPAPEQGPGICILNQPHDEVIIQAQVSQIQEHKVVRASPGLLASPSHSQPDPTEVLDRSERHVSRMWLWLFPVYRKGD